MRKLLFSGFLFVFSLLIFSQCSTTTESGRIKQDFDAGWRFYPGDAEGAQQVSYIDTGWRALNLPHDWSIEGKFSKDNPATPGGGALPDGMGWYRKTFSLPKAYQGKRVFIDFDGVYMNSKVWINGHLLGERPYGYISFRYELTPYLNPEGGKNILAVRVDNSKQPASRWYSGSGIYRNVWLVITNNVYVDHWGTYITTPEISADQAKIRLQIKIRNRETNARQVQLQTVIYDASGGKVASGETPATIPRDSFVVVQQDLVVLQPSLWSDTNPYLYKAVSWVKSGDEIIDRVETPLGIRSFRFDADKGFFLNGKHVKIRGVCDHHDLGALGAAINTRALERQLEILKGMGCNGIRTSHNPPAPELLNLCDKMGFIVMDEAFDAWEKAKRPYDYHLYFDQWYKKDITDFILRDRNHPSVIIWSIGNEIPEQYSQRGAELGKELAGIVKSLDSTRPITSAMNNPENEHNFLARSGACDLIGHNYDLKDWPRFHEVFPGGKFIASETTSAIATRGHYDMPSDSIRRWPPRAVMKKIYQLLREKKEEDIDFEKLFARYHVMNADYTCSSYDNCSVPWGSTHEETWKVVKKYDFVSGMYIWTGFDYLGEPTPYPWPARSSYFGIIDLAGFPKDAYYMYQSEWTDKDVLHVFPHWNWNDGDTVDVWAYTNCDEVELFLNGKSLGKKSKQGDDLHIMWRVPWTPGTVKAIGHRNGKELTTEVKTAGAPAKILLSADRSRIHADGKDLSFVTVTVVDKDGTMVPDADNLVRFKIDGPVTIAGVDNGCQTSLEPFKADYRKAFNGKCLVILKSSEDKGTATLTATSDGLTEASVSLDIR
ncbi:MAG: DUF4982 domain-containing protein [Bacteroidales bacterium]|nr:DUF4982 domain-containing protein [Bacteroidales bacterium]